MADFLDTEKVVEIKTTPNEVYELIKQQTPREEHEYELVSAVPMKQKKTSQDMNLSSTSHATQALYHNITIQDTPIDLQPLSCHQHEPFPDKITTPTSDSTKVSSVHKASKKLQHKIDPPDQMTPRVSTVKCSHLPQEDSHQFTTTNSTPKFYINIEVKKTN